MYQVQILCGSDPLLSLMSVERGSITDYIVLVPALDDGGLVTPLGSLLLTDPVLDAVASIIICFDFSNDE